MFNKWLSLHDKINDLEVENARLRQTINFKNREIVQLEKGSYKIINNKEVTKHINELKAELIYWKETAEHWESLYKDAESDLHYWQKYSSDLENALNNIIKK